MTDVESTPGGEATGDLGESPPAFSPEGLVHWLYGRCTRGELLTAANQDPGSILQEMLTYLHHATYEEYENASSMLHLVDDLSSDEDSPNAPHGPPDELVTGMMAAAAATTLAGCDSGSSGDAGGCTLSVPTLLCMLYSCWMLQASPWHDMNYVERPPVTALAPTGPQTTEDTQPALEGLVTPTLKMVLERHGRAQRDSNVGKILKYAQGKRWVFWPTCLAQASKEPGCWSHSAVTMSRVHMMSRLAMDTHQK